MNTLKLQNVSTNAQDYMKELGPNAKGETVPVRGIIELTEEQFTGNFDVAGKIRLGIFRPVGEVPAWAVDPLKTLGVRL